MGKISISIALLLVIVLAAVIVAAAVSALITYSVHKKSVEKKIGNAEDKAREILDEALKNAEAKKREGLLEVKEESIKAKNELDREIKDRRAEAQRFERRVQLKEETVEHCLLFLVLQRPRTGNIAHHRLPETQIEQ